MQKNSGPGHHILECGQGEKNLKIFFRLSKQDAVLLIYFKKIYKIVLDKLHECIYTVYIGMHSICTVYAAGVGSTNKRRSFLWNERN